MKEAFYHNQIRTFLNSDLSQLKLTKIAGKVLVWIILWPQIKKTFLNSKKKDMLSSIICLRDKTMEKSVTYHQLKSKTNRVKSYH